MWSLILCLTSAPALPWPESRDLPDLTALWEADRADLLWGFRNLYNPMVVYDGPGEYPYRMWLFGWAAEDDNPGHAGADAVFTARSKDLREWEVYAGEAGWDTTMTPGNCMPLNPRYKYPGKTYKKG